MSRFLYALYTVFAMATVVLMYAAVLCHDRVAIYHYASFAVISALFAGVTIALAVVAERRNL